jgi:hypothetical protein
MPAGLRQQGWRCAPIFLFLYFPWLRTMAFAGALLQQPRVADSTLA